MSRSSSSNSESLEDIAPQGPRIPWGSRPAPLTPRQVTTVALLSSLVVVAKWAVRIPIGVPGHSGLLWIAIFVVGRGILDRRGAGLMLGVVAGVLAAILVPAREGLLVFVKYAAAGLVLDIVATLIGERLDRPFPAAVAGALAHVAKLLSALILGWATGVPMGFLALGLGLSATTHVVFGALGGILGALILRQFERLQIPAIQAIRAEGTRRR